MTGPQKVYRELRDGPATLNDIADALEATPKAVATWLKRCEDYGMAKRVMRLPTKGRPLTVWSAN